MYAHTSDVCASRGHPWVDCHCVPDPDVTWHSRLRVVDENVPVYGTSLAMLLDAALDGGDIAHLETGRLQLARHHE
jgi:hypothetical protein